MAAAVKHRAGSTSADEVIAVIRRKGGRASTALRVIVEALNAAGGHRSAEELAEHIHAAHPDIHQSTIYRTLDRLEELGVAYHSHLGHGPAQWHLATSSHQHLTCRACGTTIEVDLAIFKDLQAALRTKIGFQADLHHFALSGICRTCNPQTR